MAQAFYTPREAVVVMDHQVVSPLLHFNGDTLCPPGGYVALLRHAIHRRKEGRNLEVETRIGNILVVALDNPLTVHVSPRYCRASDVSSLQAALALVAGGHMRELPAAKGSIQHSPEGPFMADPFIAQASRHLVPGALPTEYYLRVLCTDIDPNLTDHVIDQDNFLTPGAVVIEQLRLAHELPEEQKLAWAGPFRIIHFAATIIFQDNRHAAEDGAARFKRSVRLAARAMLHDDEGRGILAAWRNHLAENHVHNLARWLAAAIEQFGRGTEALLGVHRQRPSREELVHRLEDLCGMLREALQAATQELAAHAERIAALTPAAR